MTYHTYIFNWHENIKYSEPIDRNNKIQASDPQTATTIFMKNFGNLKKNTINYIQEIDENGNNIGQPIIPDKGTINLKEKFKNAVKPQAEEVEE